MVFYYIAITVLNNLHAGCHLLSPHYVCSEWMVLSQTLLIIIHYTSSITFTSMVVL